MMDERDALLDEMQRQQQQQSSAAQKAIEAGGITGGQEAKDAKAAQDYTQLGEYANRLGAFSGNTDKLNRAWDDKSERYKMLTVMSHFDPNAGVTPEMIAALNGANIYGAKFSGSGDKLTVDNAGGYDRFGTGGTGDVIAGFKDPNNTNKQWGAWQVDDGPQAPQGGAPMMGGGGLSTSSALQALTGGDTYNSLVARLQQILGPASTDRSALMSLLQR